MGLKSAHSQESDFQESGDRALLKTVFVLQGHAFGYTQAYLWLVILIAAVEQIYDQITRRLVADRVAPAVRVILSQTQAFGDRGY